MYDHWRWLMNDHWALWLWITLLATDFAANYCTNGRSSQDVLLGGCTASECQCGYCKNDGFHLFAPMTLLYSRTVILSI